MYYVLWKSLLAVFYVAEHFVQFIVWQRHYLNTLTVLKRLQILVFFITNYAENIVLAFDIGLDLAEVLDMELAYAILRT